jgi:hypothetical protein
MEDRARFDGGKRNYILDNQDPFYFQKLDELHGKLKAKTAKMGSELASGLEEPNVGLYLPLASEAFRGLVKEQAACETQVTLLLQAFRKLGEYYHEEGHPIRDMNWPHVHTNFLEDVSATFQDICEWLEAVFPDERLRAQCGNSVKAVSAAASFRSLEEVRLRIIATWSETYKEFVHSSKGFEQADPVVIMTLAITTTFILELCHHLQKCGKHLEAITHQFPAMDVNHSHHN